MTLFATPITDIEYMKPGEFSIACIDDKVLFQFKKSSTKVETIEIPSHCPSELEEGKAYFHYQIEKGEVVVYLSSLHETLKVYHDGNYFHLDHIHHFIQQELQLT